MAKKRTKKKTTGKEAATKSDSEVRLQRVLAAAGFGSRRKCEELITDGRIVVDGELVTELGTKVNPKTSKIAVDGSVIKKQKPVYFALNKPVGIVTTNRDPHGRPRVVDLVNERERVFPVGRLDRSSEGLILLTNDGDLTEQLTHPRFGVKKVYQVTVAGSVDAETMQKMRKGVHFAEGRFQVFGARIRKKRTKATELEIELTEGKNREIRRILARLGHKVLQLKRIAIANVRLGQMPVGAYRPLTSTELKKLREEIEIAKKGVSESLTPKRRAVSKGRPSSPGRPKVKGGKKASPSKTERPTGRKSSSSEVVISSGAAGEASGTIIGAGEEFGKRPNKKRTARGGAPKRRPSKSGGARRKTKRR